MKPWKRLGQYCLSSNFLFWVALGVLSLPNFCLFFTEKMSVTGRWANVLFPVPLYALLLLWQKRTGRQIWVLFPLIFFSAFQMVLLYLYGHSVIAVDMFLNLVTTNTGEALELLDNLLPGMIFVLVVYVPLLVLALVSWIRHIDWAVTTQRTYRKWARYAACGGLGILLWAKFSSPDYSVRNHLYPVNVFYNLWLAIARSQATANYANTSRDFRFHATATHPQTAREIYILVVGETARACNFAWYGYPRPTNPELKTAKGLVTFDKALTQSNTTHKSVPMLLSAISANNYDSIYQQKGILTAFQEAGFHTAFLSNQLPNHSFIDLFGKAADTWCFVKELPHDSGGYDDALLALLDAQLQQPYEKQFIVLHTYGSHFNYQERYPRSQAFFQPDGPADATPKNREALVHAYDNTLRYTDMFLAAVVKRIAHTGALGAMLYTSDHGENLFDDSRQLFLHASPIPSYYELHVPLVVWLSSPYCHAYPEAMTNLQHNATRRVATSESVFHTLLDLAGIRSPHLQRQRSVASATYEPGKLLYVDDHNEAVPLEAILHSPKDVEQLRRIGVKVAWP